MKKISSLENLIYLTILALPSYLFRFSFFGIPTNVLDILILLCIVWRLFFYKEKINCKLLFEKYKPFIFSAGLILFGLVVSILVNKNYAVGLGIVKSWFILPVLFFLVAASAVSDEKKENIFLAYYASAFFVALISLGYFFLGHLPAMIYLPDMLTQVMQAGIVLQTGITYDGRLAGIFNSPNYLAMYLSPALIIAIAQTQSAKLKAQNYNSKLKNLLIISILVILAAFYLTYSYAAWTAMIAGFLIMELVKNKFKINFKKLLFAIGIIIILILSQWNNKKFENLRSFDSRSSFESRIMIWRSAEKILADNWIWGIGAGNFQEKYLENQKYFPPYLEWAVPHPHNLYLTFWLYGGIFGLIGFLALLYFWFAYIWRKTKNPQLKFIALGIMFYVLLHGLVDTTYFKNDLAIIFWILFAI